MDYGRLVSFRLGVRFKSSDFSDLRTKPSPHGGTVEMAQNSRSRQATSPREGHVRATVHVEGMVCSGWVRWILSVMGIFRQ